jgi:cell shape-determining protein MreC
MEYLLSLVGKDQETIKEAIKELAENSVKVKALKKENSDLHDELVGSKIDQKYDLIEDMECEMETN